MPIYARRTVLDLAAGACAVAATSRLGRAAAQAPAIVTADAMRVDVPYGAQVGDVSGDRAIVWSKADRAARMQVRWATTESMAGAVAAPIVDALEDRDFIGKVDLAGLPAGQRIFYEVSFLDLGDLKSRSRPVGQLRHTSGGPTGRPLRLVRRHGGAGLGHQSGPGRRPDLRFDAPRGARFLHSFR